MAKEIKKLSGRLKITPIRKTTVLEISYSDRTPTAAQQVLQEMQRAYLDKHLKVLRPAGASKVFSDQASYYDARLTDAEQKLADLEIANNVVSLASEKESVGKDLDATRTALLQENAGAEAQRAQLAALRNELRTVPERIPTTSRSSSNYYALQQVTGVLVDLENKRTVLLTRYQPTDRLVGEVDQEIANTRAEIKHLQSEPNAENDSDVSTIWTQLQQQLKGGQVALAAGLAKTKALQAQALGLEARVNQLQNVGVVDNKLQREVTELRDGQRLYADKRDSELLEDVLDHAKVGNVAVAMEPSFSQLPVSPRIGLNLGLGLVTAIMLCIAVLFASNRTAGRSTPLPNSKPPLASEFSQPYPSSPRCYWRQI